MGRSPEVEPQSIYCAVSHKGHTYHLFNAKRMPIGRMATMIAQLIRGKHKPGYKFNATGASEKSRNIFDTCIVVNMGDPLMTGRKMQQKVYRHHTGYPGGLKEFSYKHVRETNPERILNEAVMGMLPKNKLRDDILKKGLVMFRGQYHTYHHVGLPQFTDPVPANVNELTGLLEPTPETHKIIFASNPEEPLPEEFKDFKVDIDPTIALPIYARDKTQTRVKKMLKQGAAANRFSNRKNRYRINK